MVSIKRFRNDCALAFIIMCIVLPDALSTGTGYIPSSSSQKKSDDDWTEGKDFNCTEDGYYYHDECTNLVSCDCEWGNCLSTRMGCDDPPLEGLAISAKNSCCITVGRKSYKSCGSWIKKHRLK